ncbi:hypothetical protein [Mesorhizobium sp. ANAO-SY3R2]|uniref:hypothetical protein n=1 Tax=Mesorhizobium sp. ANAO-SY3R2 TaxID=3166644 RepID=UPI00366AB95B
MRRYLSVLACSGLLSIGALYGAPAFAGSIPRSISDIAPTIGSAWHGDLGGGLQLVRGGGGHGGGGMGGGGHGGMGGGHHGGIMFPSGGGGQGMGGHGFHGNHFDHGSHFHNGHFHNGDFHHGHFHHRHFRNNNFLFNNGEGDPWYSYCPPYYSNYYGSCYPGY